MTKAGLIVVEDTMTNLRDAPKNVRKASREVTLTMARFAVDEIKRSIRANLIKPSKSPEWAKRSKSKITLINTRQYINGLQARRSGDSAVIAGDFILATLLEGGTKNMRPRPHIRPALRKVNASLGELAGTKFTEDLFG